MAFRGVLASASFALVVLAAAAACGAFGAEDQPGGGSPTDASAVDGGPIDDAGNDAFAPADAPSGDFDARTPPACPPSRYGTAAVPQLLSKRVIYTPETTPVYPFGIALDATYVYWLEQTARGEDAAPYDGQGWARVLRVDRAGGKAVELARDQRYATAAALAGPYVYWGAEEKTGDELRRVPRSCTGCQPEAVLPIGDRIVRLAAASDRILFALGSYGHVYRIDVGVKPPVLAEVLTTNDYPGMTITDTDVYASSWNTTSVDRSAIATGQATKPFATVPALPNATAGLWSLATDCTWIYGVRGTRNMLYRIAIGDGSIEPVTGDTALGVFDMVADERYLYLAMPNAGGVRAFDKVSRAFFDVYDGNVFTLAVDDAGIYWGEHGGAGTVHMALKQ